MDLGMKLGFCPFPCFRDGDPGRECHHHPQPNDDSFRGSDRCALQNMQCYQFVHVEIWPPSNFNISYINLIWCLFLILRQNNAFFENTMMTMNPSNEFPLCMILHEDCYFILIFQNDSNDKKWILKKYILHAPSQGDPHFWFVFSSLKIKDASKGVPPKYETNRFFLIRKADFDPNNLLW